MGGCASKHLDHLILLNSNVASNLSGNIVQEVESEDRSTCTNTDGFTKSQSQSLVYGDDIMTHRKDLAVNGRNVPFQNQPTHLAKSVAFSSGTKPRAEKSIYVYSRRDRKKRFPQRCVGRSAVCSSKSGRENKCQEILKSLEVSSKQPSSLGGREALTEVGLNNKITQIPIAVMKALKHRVFDGDARIMERYRLHAGMISKLETVATQSKFQPTDIIQNCSTSGRQARLKTCGETNAIRSIIHVRQVNSNVENRFKTLLENKLCPILINGSILPPKQISNLKRVISIGTGESFNLTCLQENMDNKNTDDVGATKKPMQNINGESKHKTDINLLHKLTAHTHMPLRYTYSTDKLEIHETLTIFFGPCLSITDTFLSNNEVFAPAKSTKSPKRSLKQFIINRLTGTPRREGEVSTSSDAAVMLTVSDNNSIVMKSLHLEVHAIHSECATVESIKNVSLWSDDTPASELVLTLPEGTGFECVRTKSVSQCLLPPVDRASLNCKKAKRNDGTARRKVVINNENLPVINVRPKLPMTPSSKAPAALQPIKSFPSHYGAVGKQTPLTKKEIKRKPIFLPPLQRAKGARPSTRNTPMITKKYSIKSTANF